MELEAPFFRDFLIDISDNPATGHSASFNLGAHPGFAPVAVRSPADLKGVDRLTFTVADVDAADDTGFANPITSDGQVPYVALATYRHSVVAPTISRGCLGSAFIRVMTTDATNTPEEPTGDITFRVYFSQVALTGAIGE